MGILTIILVAAILFVAGRICEVAFGWTSRVLLIVIQITGLVLFVSGIVLTAKRFNEIMAEALCKCAQFAVMIASMFTWSFDCVVPSESSRSIYLILFGMALMAYGTTRLLLPEKNSD